MSESFDREAAIEAYLKHVALGPDDEEYFWGWEAVMEFVDGPLPRLGNSSWNSSIA